MGKKSLFWPVMIGVVIIAIIIYLVANLKQPYVTCSIRNNNDVATVDEKLLVTFNSDTISNIKYDKTVYLNDKYKESVHTNSIKENFLSKIVKFFENTEELIVNFFELLGSDFIL